MIEEWGKTPDGRAVHRVKLSNGGLEACFLTYGAVLQDLRLEGHAPPLVLGFPEFESYLTDSPFFGAIAGRCANRIRNGHFEIDGQQFNLHKNFLNKHTLHGGSESAGKLIWTIVEHTAAGVTMSLRLADGHMGFPGQVDLLVTANLLEGAVLDFEMSATTKAPTLVNLAHHSYFNLDGSENVLHHRLRVDAEAYLPVDSELIPTGAVQPVEGTQFDFRVGAKIRTDGLLDHNFCLSSERRSIRPVAWLSSPESGVKMECRTTEPGLQIYDGAKISIDRPGLTGLPMGARAGIALEPQVWPDANHHPEFPQAVLRPGDVYMQHTQFAFQKEHR